MGENEPRPIISDSRFSMWRAVFAMAHADNKLVYKEKRMLLEILQKRPFTLEQREILKKDLDDPQDIEEMFDNIAEKEDVVDFFGLARALAWCDGDYDEQEREILEKLQKRSGLSIVEAGLQETRDSERTKKLNQVFKSAGFGGLVDMVEKDTTND